MTMTTDNWINVGAAVVSFLSMIAAIVSACNTRKNARIAQEAKEQARQAATLASRGEVIGHLDAAVRALKQGTPFQREVLGSLEQAKLNAARVFGNEITNDLDRKLKLVRDFAADPH
jgi:hypothetical protein